MIELVIPAEIREALRSALDDAGKREVGGVLMAEHVGPNRFELKEVTVHRRGTLASFIRRIEEAIGRLASFFDRTKHDYARFNYIGEWHSHPIFEPEPSGRDDLSMMEIVRDQDVGANFAVLLVVKLDESGQLVGTLHTYLPDGSKYRSDVRYV